MPDYWKVLNKTYIFGGATVYQTANISVKDLLSCNVSDPDLWITKAQDGDVKSGKIFSDELTHTLLDGVGGVTVKKNCQEIEIIYGHGGLLGGMDKKLTYTPINKENYDHLNTASESFKQYDTLLSDTYYSGLTGSDLERSMVAPENLQKYENYLKDQQDEAALRVATKIYRNTTDFLWMDCSHTVGLLKPDARLTPEQLNIFPSNTTTLSEAPINLKSIKRGFKETKSKQKEIRTIYYCPYPLPVILVMKDESQYMVAPQISIQEPEFARKVLDEIRVARKDKEQELQKVFFSC